ncbi:TIGR01777 family oxidoreductase [Cerasicoccus fimbriatus]|uniref:TIGR01777 family oxidoreductase n=1 Tax=Cerasicoccus fimbriatus TaxID=3014554 RepID=UPI0022B4441E|nr:TIGR01777 family oxidoreductase [Cerasicoccus sp. TK19100]
MPNAKRIAITGATGLVGTALTTALRARGDEVVPISRSSQPGGVVWDVEQGELPDNALEGIDAVIHLAGAGVADERWTDERKRILRDSRIKSANMLVDVMRKMAKPPSVFLSASGVGYYGAQPGAEVDESAPLGQGFLAEICRDWESAAMNATSVGARVAIARTGVVLAENGGALDRMLPPFKLGVGGPIGSGKQRLGWIALDDAVSAYLFLLDNDQASGPYNFCAPEIVTNKEFATALGKALDRPAKVPAPKIALKLAFGELVDETLLADQPAVPKRLTEMGFNFQFPTLDAALRHILK